MIAGIAVDPRIGQVVDVPNVGVTAILPLDRGLSVALSFYNSSYSKKTVASLGVDICSFISIWTRVVQ